MTHFNKKGEFQSDKYPWCKPGFVPLKLSDPTAWQPLMDYAIKRLGIDRQFAYDLIDAVLQEERTKTSGPGGKHVDNQQST